MGRIVGSNMLVLLETWSVYDSRMTQDECMMKASHDYVVAASFSNYSVESVESVESLSGSGFRKEYSCAIERFNLEAWWNRQDHPKPSNKNIKKHKTVLQTASERRVQNTTIATSCHFLSKCAQVDFMSLSFRRSFHEIMRSKKHKRTSEPS